MQDQLVMTIIGKDRTGLVESLARLISDNGGNWLESRLCHLGGEFAGVLRIEVPKERDQPLRQALQVLHSQGLTVTVRLDEATPTPGLTRSASLNLTGQDRPGIIHQITAVLAHQNINVEELATNRYSAAMSGEMIFSAKARLQVPEACHIKELRRELEKLGEELMIDISFTEN